MKAGIIGAGAIAFDAGQLGLPMTHAKSYAALDSAIELVAFVEPDPTQREVVIALHPELHHYTSIQSMLEGETLDVVSLCTPDSMHETMLLEILDSPVKGIWCEKPMGLTAAGVAAIAEKAQSRGVCIQVNYWRRFVPEIRKVADDVRQGRFGRLLRMSGIYPETYIHNGCHLFDLIEMFAGPYTPLRLSGVDRIDSSSDGCLTVIGEAGGAEVVCVGIPRTPYNIFELDMFYEEGRIRIAENGRRIEISGHAQDNEFSHLRLLNPEPSVVTCDWQRSFDYGLDDLLESIRGHRPPLCGFKSSIACARTLDEVASLICSAA